MKAGTIELVDPEHREIARNIPVFNPGHDTSEDIRQRLIAAYAILVPPTSTGHTEQRVPGPSDAPDVRVLVYRPAGSHSALPAMLYIHGGGFIAGTPDMCDAASARLAEEHGMVVVAVDYRLAPEARFPGPLEDCYAALAWMFECSSALGIDPGRIGVFGDSAGGGLAAALCLLARDRGVHVLKAAFLSYPMLDHRTGTLDEVVDNPFTGEFVWTRAANVFAWSLYRADHELGSPQTGYFSPTLAEDVSGLPRTFVATGSLDLFLEEGVAYALRLLRAGGTVDLRVYPGGIHAFDRLPGRLGTRFAADFSISIQNLLLD